MILEIYQNNKAAFRRNKQSAGILTGEVLNKICLIATFNHFLLITHNDTTYDEARFGQ